MKTVIAGLREHVRSIGVIRTVLCYIVAAVVGAGGMYVALLSLTPPAVPFVNVREVDGVAIVGGRLELLFTLPEKQSPCSATVDRWLWQWRDIAGQRVPYIAPIAALGRGGSAHGARQAILSLPMPDGITPGDWWYGSRTTRYCMPFSFFGVYTETFSQDTYVKVVR